MKNIVHKSWPKENCINNQQGYIALITVLMMIIVMIVTGVTVALLSISDVQMSMSDQYSNKAIALVDSCVDEVLLEINENSTVPSTVSLPEGNCGVTLNSQTGNDWSFFVTGVYQGYNKTVQVSATRTNTLIINSWKEI